MAVSVTGNVRNGLTKIVLPALRRSGCYECHTPMQWVPGALSPGVKRPGREADHTSFQCRGRECVVLHIQLTTSSWRGA